MVVGSHQLARAYASQNHRVLHLSLPFSLLHVARLGKPMMLNRLRTAVFGTHQRQDNLFEHIPISMIPWDVAKYSSKLTTANLSMPMSYRIRKVLRELGMQRVDIALIDEPRMVGIERTLNAKKTIYRATDLYAKFRQDDWVLDAEARIMDHSDAVFATSQPVADHLTSLQRIKCQRIKPVNVFTNGFDAEHFRNAVPTHPSLLKLPADNRIRLVYVGAIDHRFDLASVLSMANCFPQADVLLYGPVFISVPDTLPPNLRMMGPLPYAELPAVLQHCEISLLPLTDIATNHGRSPMKYYEYRSAGSRIVSLAIESLTAVGETDSELFLYPNADAESLCHAVQRAIDAGPKTDPSIALGSSELGSSELGSRSWNQIARRMLDEIENA